MNYYLVLVIFDSGGLKESPQEFCRLQGGGGIFSRLAQFQASNEFSSLVGLGSVIQTSACVTVTNQTSGLK